MRPPAHPGIHVGTFEWRPFPECWKSSYEPLLQALGHDVEAAVSRDVGPPRYLRRLSVDGDGLFIKIAPQKNFMNEHKSQKLAAALFKHGVQTPAPHSEIPAPSGQAAFVYDWCDGHHVSIENVEFKKLGRAVAALHKALEREADSFNVKVRTRNRLVHFADLARSPAFEKKWAHSRWRDQAHVARDNFIRFLDPMLDKGKASHGDLNPGNILVTEYGFTFLDFEDALHSWLWPGLDLAKIIERLILLEVENRGLDWAGNVVGELLTGYGETNGDLEGDGEITLPQALLWHIGLSVICLTKLSHDLKTTDGEMSKFIYLAALIGRYDKLFFSDGAD